MTATNTGTADSSGRRSVSLVDKSVVGIGLLLVLVFAGLAASGNLSFLDPSGCGWQTLEVDGETYSSLEELDRAAKQHGTSLAEMRDRAEFRVRDGVVQFRPTGVDCGRQSGGGG